MKPNQVQDAVRHVAGLGIYLDTLYVEDDAFDALVASNEPDAGKQALCRVTGQFLVDISVTGHPAVSVLVRPLRVMGAVPRTEDGTDLPLYTDGSNDGLNDEPGSWPEDL